MFKETITVYYKADIRTDGREGYHRTYKLRVLKFCGITVLSSEVVYD